LELSFKGVRDGFFDVLLLLLVGVNIVLDVSRVFIVLALTTEAGVITTVEVVVRAAES